MSPRGRSRDAVSTTWSHLRGFLVTSITSTPAIRPRQQTGSSLPLSVFRCRGGRLAGRALRALLQAAEDADDRAFLKADIVGAPTARTNGNVNPFGLPESARCAATPAERLVSTRGGGFPVSFALRALSLDDTTRTMCLWRFPRTQ